MYLVDKLQLIKNMAANNTVEYILADYFLKKMTTIKKITLKAITMETKVSRTSIIRFCQKAGYSGFTIFIDVLADEIKEQQEMIMHYDSIDLDFYNQNVANFFNECQKMIEPYYMSLIESLLKSNRIIFFGGEKYLSCFPLLVNNLFFKEKEVILNYCWDLTKQIELFEQLDQDDLIIFIEPFMNYRTYHELLMLAPGPIEIIDQTPAKKAFLGQEIDDEVTISLPLPYTYYDLLYRSYFIYLDMFLITELNRRDS